MEVKATRIFGLVDPFTRQLTHIGASREQDVCDLYRHLLNARHFGRLVDGWLHGLAIKGAIPDVIVLEKVADADWQEALEFWREYYRGLGSELLPTGTGPDGGARERPRELTVNL